MTFFNFVQSFLPQFWKTWVRCCILPPGKTWIWTFLYGSTLLILPTIESPKINVSVEFSARRFNFLRFFASVKPVWCFTNSSGILFTWVLALAFIGGDVVSGSAPSTDVEPTNYSSSCELLMDNTPKLELWLSKWSIKKISPSLATLTWKLWENVLPQASKIDISCF